VASIVGHGGAGLVDGLAPAGLGPREIVIRFGDGAKCGSQGRGGAALLAELVDEIGVFAHRAQDGA